MNTIVCVLFASLICVVLPAQYAFADDPLAMPTDAKAAEHLRAGKRLYGIREFEKAIEEYKAGALVEDVPVFLFNIGQCFRKLNRYDDAIWHFERFLDRGQPTGDVKDVVEKLLVELREAKRKASEPAPAKTMGITTPGEPWYRDRIGWSLAGVGAVAAVASVYFLVDARGLDNDSNLEPDGETRDELRDRAKSRRLIGSIVGIGSVGLLAAGIVKLAVRRQGEERIVTTTWQLRIMQNGLALSGSF